MRYVLQLGEFMIVHGHGTTLGHIELHRSKCACLVQNIISLVLRTDLIDDSEQYTIITNESTDISTQKHLCMFDF